MTLPTDFSRDLADRVPQPGFDLVVSRARQERRRRRTALASGLGATILLTGIGWAAGSSGDDGPPEPAAPVTTPDRDGPSIVDSRLPADVRAILEADRVDVFDAAATSDGAFAALWAACGADGTDGCRNALVVERGDEVHGLVVDGDPRAITAVPGGWLVEEGSGPVVVDPSGQQHAVLESGPGTTRAEPGDTAVVVHGQWRLLRGDRLVDVPIPLDDPTTLQGAYVSPDGLLAVAVEDAATGFEVAVSDDGGASWSAGGLRISDVGPSDTRGPRDEVHSLVLAGAGDDLAVVALGEAPGSESIPLVDLRTSQDGGTSWTQADGLGFGSQEDAWMRPSDLSSVAVTTSGTTYVATASHHLVRVYPDGRAVPVQFSSFDRDAFAVGDNICVVSETGRTDRLTCSDDDGTSWSDRSLPGLR